MTSTLIIVIIIIAFKLHLKNVIENIQDLSELEWCITHHLFNCLFKNPIHLKASLEELEAIMEKCAHYCLYGENKHEGIRLAPCFLDCWEKYTKKRN